MARTRLCQKKGSGSRQDFRAIKKSRRKETKVLTTSATYLRKLSFGTEPSLNLKVATRNGWPGSQPRRLLAPAFVCVVTFFCVNGLGLFPSVAEACPNCKDTLAEHGGRLQYGYALSIALMIAMPFGILAAWATAIYRMLKISGDTQDLPGARKISGNT